MATLKAGGIQQPGRPLYTASLLFSPREAAVSQNFWGKLPVTLNVGGPTWSHGFHGSPLEKRVVAFPTQSMNHVVSLVTLVPGCNRDL